MPVNEIEHEGSPGAVALPVALQLSVVPLVRFPCAVPVNFSSPAQVALKFPLALVAVCSDTSHLKSVQAVGEGMMLVEVQLPRNALAPEAEGPVMLLPRSKPMHPLATRAEIDSRATEIRFVMMFFSAEDGHPGTRRWLTLVEEVYQP